MSTREGVLKLKRDGGGWRHYIELPTGAHLDLYCGSTIEIAEYKMVETMDQEYIEPTGNWITGRYEASLTRETRDEVKAYVYLSLLNTGDNLCSVLPLGTRVRKPEWNPFD